MVRLRMFSAAIAALMVGIWTSSAQAYLDPGTGSMILQVLLGGLAGLALAGKLYWQKLLSFLRIRKDATAESGATEDRNRPADARRR